MISSPAAKLPQKFNAASYFVDRHLEEGRGARVAIECGEERVTYAQLAERVNRAGNALRELGVRPEERVLLLLVDTPEFAYAFFGAIKIGAIPVPVNTLLRSPDYEYLLNDSRARALIVNQALWPQIEAIPRERRRNLRDIIVAGGAPAAQTPAGAHSLTSLLAAQSPQLEAEATGKDWPCFWLYSSGSTGFPKGCVHLEHDMVVAAELYARGVLRITEQDRFFSVAKLFFAYGLGNALYFPLLVGGTSILCSGAPTAKAVFEVIARHRPTLLFSVPSNYAALLDYRRPEGGEFDLSSIRYGVSAGEALPPALFRRFQERFGAEILDGIGSTEALHIFISNAPGAVRPGSSGKLVAGFDAKIIDEQGQAVPAGEIGNLIIRTDSACAYYWNQHEKSKETIEGHWLRTGDKYRQDQDGYFWYAGRSDDMMKVSGVWVSPAEIESTLVEHPAVAEVAVVGRPDKDDLVKPAAWVVLRAGMAGTPELAQELCDFVTRRLPVYKRPRWVEFVPELPKTATGKVQRFKLRQQRGADRG